MPKPVAHRGSRLRRTPKEWLWRGALALAAVALGWSAVAHTLAYALRTSALDQAYAFAPHDGRILALMSEKLSGAEATHIDRLRADRYARAAVLRDPTAVAAVATLGLNAAIRGKEAHSRLLFRYSDRLSRRDLRTRLWAIEDAVARNDIPSALRNYDIALRTSRFAPELLYPVLAVAISDPAIASPLARTMAAKPPWAEGFIGYLASNGSDPVATARLFRQINRAGVPVPDLARATVIKALIADGELEQAWAYYAGQVANADRQRSRDPAFDAVLTTPSSFDWLPGEGSGISATIQRGNQGGVFDFAVAPSVGGVLLHQFQLLPPGMYTLDGRSGGLDQPEESQPYWVLTCTDGRELGRVAVPNSSKADGRFGGRFTVPGGCPMQDLTLVARATSQISGVLGQIKHVQLGPVRQ